MLTCPGYSIEGVRFQVPHEALCTTSNDYHIAHGGICTDCAERRRYLATQAEQDPSVLGLMSHPGRLKKNRGKPSER